MILALSLMPAEYVLDENIKIPTGALSRTMISVHSTGEIKAAIARIWDNYMTEPEAGPAWIQADIVEGRKPNGLSEAAKAGTLGVNVWLTKNLIKARKRVGKL